MQLKNLELEDLQVKQVKLINKCVNYPTMK